MRIPRERGQSLGIVSPARDCFSHPVVRICLQGETARVVQILPLTA
ncbi:hypothetical protein [Intrasporangium sp.]|jgi:hypothetical protein